MSAALVLSGVGVALGSPASAAAVPVDPAISGDANASNGTVAFYNAAGTKVTAGADLTHLFDYALASTNATRAATKATLFFGFPDHTKADSTTWFESQQSASTTYPNATAPAPLSTATQPLVKLTSTDGNLSGLLGTTTQDQTTGFKNILQVRVYDTGPGVPKTAPFWATAISFDSVAGTWQQEYPAPPATTAPGAPTGVTATAHDASADIGWTAPVSDGGSAITKYTVTAVPTTGSGTVTKDVTGAVSTTISGLTNGKTYNVTVTATNAIGTSAASSPAVQVSPVAAPTAPGAPTGVISTPGDTTADVSWTAPSSTGGSALTKYTVTAVPTTGTTVTKDVVGATSTQLTGLVNDVQYSLTVTATNAIGTGVASSPAVTVTPKAPTAPGAPTGVAATPGDTTANVSWTAPASNGGSALTKYTVTAVPAEGSTVTKDVVGATSTQLTGLVNDVQYSVTVTATNAIGTGVASSPPVTVTPTISQLNTGLGLSASRTSTTAGESYVVSGVLVGGETGGKVITVRGTVAGSAPVSTNLVTNAEGRFSLTVSGRYSTTYQAFFAGNATQKPAVSSVRKVSTAPRITVLHPVSSNTRTTNRTLVVTGAVYPTLAGQVVSLVLRGSNGSTVLVSTHINAEGHFTLKRTLAKGTYLMQVVMAPTAKNAAGGSRLFRVYEV